MSFLFIHLFFFGRQIPSHCLGVLSWIACNRVCYVTVVVRHLSIHTFANLGVLISPIHVTDHCQELVPKPLTISSRSMANWRRCSQSSRPKRARMGNPRCCITAFFCSILSVFARRGESVVISTGASVFLFLDLVISLFLVPCSCSFAAPCSSSFY